jgi:acylphosphatase
MTMKLKIKIIGPKVHDVGYRYFLMSNAIDIGLKGFQARNRMNEKEQEVTALVEGDEEAIADFKELLETRKPEHSEVSKVAFENYKGDVMRAGEYAQVCSALQLNKAIPVLLAIRDNTKMIPQIGEDIKAARKTTDATLDEIKGLREDIQPGYATNFRQMQTDIRAIKERLGMQ